MYQTALAEVATHSKLLRNPRVNCWIRWVGGDEGAQTDAGGGELVHRVDEVAEIAAEAVELPHDERTSVVKGARL